MDAAANNAPLPPPPEDGHLKWVMQNPEELAAYLATVRAMRRLTITVVIGGKSYQYPILFSGENAGVTIPIS